MRKASSEISRLRKILEEIGYLEYQQLGYCIFSLVQSIRHSQKLAGCVGLVLIFSCKYLGGWLGCG